MGTTALPPHRLYYLHNFVQALEWVRAHAAEFGGEGALKLRIEVLPESATAADDVFPQPRLAFVHAGRDAVAER